MGYEARKNAENAEKNGSAPHGSPPLERHAPWCKAPGPEPSPCTCRPIPSYRCDSCERLFDAEPGESPVAFAERLQAHASVHPDGSTHFTEGTVLRTVREDDPPAEGV
jgi:hypothetical protein